MFSKLITVLATLVCISSARITGEKMFNPVRLWGEKSPCIPKATDLVFAFEGSASIPRQYFRKGIELIGRTVDQLNSLGWVGSGSEQTRIGAMQFGKYYYIAFPLLGNTTAIKSNMDNIFYMNASLTKISKAIDYSLSNKLLFGGARESVQKVLAIVTDCLAPNDINSVLKAAKRRADEAGVEIIVITYTSDYGQLCMDTLTGGDPTHHQLWSDMGQIRYLIGCRNCTSY